MEDVHLALVQARDRLEFPDAFKLPFEWPIMLELVPINHFDRPTFAQDIARQPDFAVTSATNPFQQFVVGHDWRLERGRRGRISRRTNGDVRCVMKQCWLGLAHGRDYGHENVRGARPNCRSFQPSCRILIGL